MKHKLTLVLLSFFLGVQCMVAQQMKVTGVVINEDDGEPVIGASIVVKGTTIGTITDLDGKFELETQKDAKLIISYGEFYQFNLSSCIRQQNSLTAQFVSFSLANLANIFYPPQFLQ